MKIDPEIKIILNGQYGVTKGGIVYSFKIKGSNKSRLKTIPHKLKQNMHPTGYMQVHLRVSKKSVTGKVHRLVLEAFGGPCPKGMQCAHLNGIPTDNRFENLRWVTSKDNMSHKKIHGTSNEGERNSQARFKTKDILLMKKRYKAGHSISKLAVAFNAKYQVIHHIIRGKRWRHLND